MPELPEVTALQHAIAERFIGAKITRAHLVSFTALKTVSIPFADLVGSRLVRVQRFGKFLALDFAAASSETDRARFSFVVHLARAGWIKLTSPAPAAIPRPGKGPLVCRLVFEDDDGLDITEAGTQRKLAIYLVSDPAEVPGIARLGLDPMSEEFTPSAFAELLDTSPRTRIKGILRDQSLLAGVGNAYSDEILHAAGLSPYTLADSLNEAQRDELYERIRTTLATAVDHAVSLEPHQLKDGKRTTMAVHGRENQACPVCNDQIASVNFSDSSFQYCPTCQTQGKKLADRRMSRLLK